MALITTIEQLNTLRSAAYGQEHLDGRNAALKFLIYLYNPYEKLINPAYLMRLWGEAVYGYKSTVSESHDRMLQTLRSPAQREWLRGEPLTPLSGGAVCWQTPHYLPNDEKCGFLEINPPTGISNEIVTRRNN